MNSHDLQYDVHTHVGLDQGFYLAGWWPYAATVQDLLGHMDAGGIDRAVCFPFCISSAFDSDAFARERAMVLRPDRFPYDLENELLVNEGERLGGDRLLPFAMFDPMRRVDAQVARLQTLVGKIAGLKTQTTVLQSPIRHLLDDGRDLMLLAQQHNLPVVIHTALVPGDRWAQVRDCLAVAEAYPKVRFNLAHTLRFDLASLKRAATMDNVWIDCAAHLVHCMLARQKSPVVAQGADALAADYANPSDVLTAAHAILGDRYIWGSDNPFQSWCDDGIKAVFEYQQEVKALRATPTRVQQDMLTHGPKAWLFGS